MSLQQIDLSVCRNGNAEVDTCKIGISVYCHVTSCTYIHVPGAQ